LAEIRSAFGGEYLNASGGLQRRALGELVFSDDAARRRLEEILHPRIRESWQSRVALWRRNGVRAGVVVIPLLFETDAAGAFEATVCVACSAMTQRLRLLDRGWSVAEIARRNGAQMDVADKMSLATHVIWSEGDKGVLNGQVRRLTERWAR
jgi:dephospho-CoA kinase